MIYRGVRAKLNDAGETDADDPNSELAANNKETRRDLSTRVAEDSDEEMGHYVRVQIHTLLDFSPLPPVSYSPLPQWCRRSYREQFSLQLELQSRSHVHSDPPKRKS